VQLLQQEMLVKSAQHGDKDAFVHLIKDAENTMYRVAKSMLRSDEACADAIQETIMKAYSSLRSVKEPNYFKTWLIRILINVCNQTLRTNKKVVLLEQWMDTPAATSSSYDTVEIQEAVDSLDDDYRVIVTLFYFEDLSIKEIAQSLDIREGTVKSRLNRARSKLARFLGFDNREEGLS
jgi:RNA polymerase sigma-70 factor, ECF subfamily